jgi:adenosine deaminase
MLKERGVTLELCPSSNLNTGVIKGIGGLKRVFRQLNKSKVKYTINTDGPEMLMTNLRNEIDLLLKNGVITEEDVLRANRNAFAATFVHST